MARKTQPPRPSEDEEIKEVTEEEIAGVAGVLNVPDTTASAAEPEVEAPIPEHLREQAAAMEEAAPDPMLERLTAAMEAIARKQEAAETSSQANQNTELAQAMAL